MAPELEPQTIHQAFTALSEERRGTGKFVREGTRIWWDSAKMRHGEIAQQAGINRPDDAGYISADRTASGQKELTVYGDSSTLGLFKDESARTRTVEVLEKLLYKSGIDVW